MRLNSVTVQGFRGASVPTTLDCQVQPGHPADCIVLHGDNGSGKSTFVDAIEFALTGSVGRRRDFNGSVEAYRNAAGQTPLVSLETSEGVTLHELPRLGESEPNFGAPPHAIRRRDITHFVSSGESRRHTFFAYFASDSQLERANQAALDAINETAAILRPVTEELPSILGVAECDFPRPNRTRSAGPTMVDGATQRLLADYWRLRKKGLMDQKNRTSKLKLGRQQLVLRSLQGFSDRLTDWFKEVSPTGDEIDRLILQIGDPSDHRVGVRVRFQDTLPLFRFEQVLSEANQDLLVLILYLTTILKRQEQVPSSPRILLLDDVLQSVDATIRSKLYRLLFREFSGWQLVFAVTDRLDRETLCREAAAAHASRVVREFDSWSLEFGPRILQSRMWSQQLRERLAAPDEPHLLVTVAGRELEKLCNLATQSMRVAVPRKPGDSYTLADTWNPLRKKLATFPELRPIVENVGALAWLRNAVGAHENTWASGVSRTESREFLAAVARLVDLLWCENCQTTLSFQQRESELACPRQCVRVTK